MYTVLEKTSKRRTELGFNNLWDMEDSARQHITFPFTIVRVIEQFRISNQRNFIKNIFNYF